MHYLRNSEVARLYNVSQTAVGKWVEQAKLGKLDLKLIERDGKSYIASSTHNRDMIEQIVQERKKYLNTRSHKVIVPPPEFYALYSPDQVRDIAESLENHREVPLQYNYLGDGAARWDRHTNRAFDEGSEGGSPEVMATNLLAMNESYIKSLLLEYVYVNVVDVGPGNGRAAKDFVQYLLDIGKKVTYTGVDISADMLSIAEKNFQRWFGAQVPFRADLRDVTHERFHDLLAKEHFGRDANRAINVVLFLGGTLGNFRSPDEVLRTLYHSMERADILIETQKLGLEANKKLFSFALNSNALPEVHNAFFDMLGVNGQVYDVEVGFDDIMQWRYARARLKVALAFEFQLPGGTRRINIPKDEAIVVWHYRHQTALQVVEQLTRNGFNVIQASQTPDHEFLLVICDIKSDR